MLGALILVFSKYSHGKWVKWCEGGIWRECGSRDLCVENKRSFFFLLFLHLISVCCFHYSEKFNFFAYWILRQKQKKEIITNSTFEFVQMKKKFFSYGCHMII